MGLPPEDERAVQKATPSLGVTVSYFRYGLASVPGITKAIRPVGRHIDILSLLVYEENRQFAGSECTDIRGAYSAPLGNSAATSCGAARSAGFVSGSPNDGRFEEESTSKGKRA
jgi:hypothetical protein